MTLRTGSKYLTTLEGRRLDVAVHGDRVHEGIPRHSAFAGTAEGYAAAFDLHVSPPDDTVLVREGVDGAYPVSLHAPSTIGELRERSAAVAAVAELSHGHLLRTPDHANSLVSAFGASEQWFASVDPAFGSRVRAYLDHVRAHDLSLGYALTLPEVNRRPDGSDQLGGQMAARVVEHRPDGIVLSGARLLATSGPLCDEILLLPATVLRGGADEAPYAFAVAIPSDAPGVRFVCRATPDSAAPLSSTTRFDEVEAAIILDEVFVPHERVLLLGNPTACNEVYRRTGAASLLTHQASVRRLVKAQFYLGLADELADRLGVDHREWVVDLLSEAISIVESCRAAITAAEAGASLNEWGLYEPEWRALAAARLAFVPAARRLPQILQEIGGMRLLTTPDAATAAVASDDVAAFFQTRFLAGSERIALMSMVSDLALSGFAARHALADAHLFGEPQRLAEVLSGSYNTAAVRARARSLISARHVTAR